MPLCCCVCLSEEETFRRIGAAVRVEQLPSVVRGVVLRIVLEVCGSVWTACCQWLNIAGNFAVHVLGGQSQGTFANSVCRVPVLLVAHL